MADVDAVDDFLESLEGYTPLIPDDVTTHFLHRSGFHSPSLHLTRLVSVSAHKFLAEVVSDAMQYSKMRQAAAGKEGRPKGQHGRDRRLVLATEDLAAALKEYGLNVRKPEYFVDGPLEPLRTLASSAPSQPASSPSPASASALPAAATTGVTAASRPLASGIGSGVSGRPSAANGSVPAPGGGKPLLTPTPPHSQQQTLARFSHTDTDGYGI